MIFCCRWFFYYYLLIGVDKYLFDFLLTNYLRFLVTQTYRLFINLYFESQFIFFLHFSLSGFMPSTAVILLHTFLKLKNFWTITIAPYFRLDTIFIFSDLALFRIIILVLSPVLKIVFGFLLHVYGVGRLTKLTDLLINLILLFPGILQFSLNHFFS